MDATHRPSDARRQRGAGRSEEPKAPLGRHQDRVAKPGRADQWHSQATANCPSSIESEEVPWTAGARCPTPRLHIVDTSTGEVVGEVPCRRRRCSVCGPKLRASYVAHYTEKLAPLPALYHVTLTLDPKAFVGSGSVLELLRQDLWTRFRKALTRACSKEGGKLTYLAGIEAHEHGWPHVHAILSIPIADAEAVIARQWFRVGGGAVLDIEAIGPTERDVARTVGYVLKHQLDPTAVPGRLMQSHGLGYDTREARAERRTHVGSEQLSTPGSIFDPVRDHPERRPRREPRQTPEFNLHRRTAKTVRRVGGDVYGISTKFDAETGGVEYGVVRRVWDGGDWTYVTLHADVGSQQKAKRIAERYDERGGNGDQD